MAEDTLFHSSKNFQQVGIFKSIQTGASTVPMYLSHHLISKFMDKTQLDLKQEF